MAAKNTGYKKVLTGAEQRALKEQLLTAQVDAVEQAKAREMRMVASLGRFTEECRWFMANKVWLTLGYGTLVDWWADRIAPLVDGLGLKPGPELAQFAFDAIQEEEASLPAAQRHSKKAIAAIVGVGEWKARGRQDQRQRRSTARTDLDNAAPIIDGEVVEDEQRAIEAPPRAEPAAEDVPDALTQAITDVAAKNSPTGPTATDDRHAKVDNGEPSGHTGRPSGDADRAASPETASVGTGVTYTAPPTEAALCPVPRDLDHCGICGEWLKERNAGYLRCPSCDPRQEHIAEATLDGQWAECRLCTAARAAATATTGSGDGPSPVAGSGPQNSPAAESIEPSHAGVPAVGDQNSPTGREGGRSETNFPVGPDQQDPRSDAPEVPAVATTVLPGIDHHRAGVSGGGHAPDGTSVELEELEDGFAAVTPSSSDPVVIPLDEIVLHLFAEFLLDLADVDPEAVAPLLTDHDAQLLAGHTADVASWAGRVLKARTP